MDCVAAGGSVTAKGDGSWGLGGLSGAPFAVQEISGCRAQNVTIVAMGDGNRLVGGLVGFAGTYEESSPGRIASCVVSGVQIRVSDSTGQVGGSTQGSEEPLPSSFAASSCTVSAGISGGTHPIGSIAGYAYRSTVTNCTANVSWSTGMLDQVGLAEPAESTEKPGGSSGCSAGSGMFVLLASLTVAFRLAARRRK